MTVLDDALRLVRTSVWSSGDDVVALLAGAGLLAADDQPRRIRLVKRSLQDRCKRWHEAVHPDDGLFKQTTKLAEECGEVGQAFIGRDENRPNRGDPEQELAQVVLVCLSIAGRRLPGFDLMARVEQELTDAEVALSLHEAVVEATALWRPLCNCWGFSDCAPDGEITCRLQLGRP